VKSGPLWYSRRALGPHDNDQGERSLHHGAPLHAARSAGAATRDDCRCCVNRARGPAKSRRPPIDHLRWRMLVFCIPCGGEPRLRTRPQTTSAPAWSSASRGAGTHNQLRSSSLEGAGFVPGSVLFAMLQAAEQASSPERPPVAGGSAPFHPWETSGRVISDSTRNVAPKCVGYDQVVRAKQAAIRRKWYLPSGVEASFGG